MPQICKEVLYDHERILKMRTDVFIQNLVISSILGSHLVISSMKTSRISTRRSLNKIELGISWKFSKEKTMHLWPCKFLGCFLQRGTNVCATLCI